MKFVSRVDKSVMTKLLNAHRKLQNYRHYNDLLNVIFMMELAVLLAMMNQYLVVSETKSYHLEIHSFMA